MNDTVWIKRALKLKGRAKRDARIDVYISKDHMAAKADFFPARAGGRPFDKEYLDAALDALGIRYGVEYKALDDTAGECGSGGVPPAGVVIARGIAPVDESPAYFKIDPALSAVRRPRAREDGAVDFRAVSPYVCVEAGREIARLEAARAGRPGKTVTGNETPFKTITRRPFTCGAGVYIQNDRIYAKDAGLLVIEENGIRIERVLRVPGAVGYATGNIAFSGDLVLDGAVADGFSIRAGGSVTTRGAFTVSDCASRGDLHVSGGLIGRGAGAVKVGGALRARFIWNCKIACKEDVVAAAEVFNSTIWTLGMLNLDGCLAASDVYALRGMRAGGVGRRSARPATIRLGTDWAAERDIASGTRALRALEKKLEEIKAEFDAAAPARRAELREAALGIRGEYAKIRERTAAKRKNLTVDTGAALAVRGVVRAGTVIEICSVRRTLREDARAVVFTLDPARRAVVSRPLRE